MPVGSWSLIPVSSAKQVVRSPDNTYCGPSTERALPRECAQVPGGCRRALVGVASSASSGSATVTGLPDVRPHWRDVMAGAFVTAVLFTAGPLNANPRA